MVNVRPEYANNLATAHGGKRSKRHKVSINLTLLFYQPFKDALHFIFSGSPFAQPAAAPRFPRTKESVKGPAARRGQHTDEILGERGFSTKEIGIEPPLTYGQFRHANCIGCLKAGKQHWYVVWCTRPDIWQRAKEAEEDIGYTIHDGVSLEELEADFAAMQAAGVEPTEHIPQQTFWANAKKRVRLKVIDESQLSLAFAKPCECVTKVRPPRWKRVALGVCDCLAAPGEGHALWCTQVWGEQSAA